MHTDPLSRRQTLRAAGAVLAGGIGAAALSAPAAADHQDAKPEYVTLSYNEELIKTYQPLLVLEGVEVEPWSYHALYAESSESDLDVVVGFHKYPYQEGYSSQDSHLGDREPVYIYVDSSSGEPIKVQYSFYHWYENTESWSDVKTDSSGKRPIMRVVPKHHQHRVYGGWKTGAEGRDLPVKNLLESYPGWLDAGLEDDIHPGAVYNPQEEMQYRDYWWREEALGTFEHILNGVWLRLGLGEGSQTDREEI